MNNIGSTASCKSTKVVDDFVGAVIIIIIIKIVTQIC